MDLRAVRRQVLADIMAGNASIVKGPPGYGKTDMGLQLVAQWFQSEKTALPTGRFGYSCFFMATQTPIGFTGLPWKGEWTYKDRAGAEVKRVVTDPAVPLWYIATCLETGERLPADCFDKVFLIIEEWGQGSPETKRAGAEVMRAGGTPPFYLPPGSPRLAFSNVDAKDGVTKEFDFIIGRRAERHVTGDVKVWIEDFADKPYKWDGKVWSVTPFSKVWAQNNSMVLFEDKPAQQGPWCNPRSYTMADRFVQVMTTLNNGVPPAKDSAFLEGVAGYIGFPAAQKYVSDLQFTVDLPKFEDLVADPMGTPVPSKADLQMLMAYTLASRVDDSSIAQVLQYMSKNSKPRMPQDMCITFVSSVMRRDYKNLLNHPAMQAWISQNAQLLGVIGALAQTK